MKTITELRTTLNFHPQEINSILSLFANNSTVDFDVYLPTKKMNLQRDFVWTLQQKRELIWSILKNRKIPRIAMMNVIVDKSDIDGVYQVIDGKQRLSTMFDFLDNKFSLEIDGKEYLFCELPQEYQRVISGYPFAYYIANEPLDEPFTDKDKIDWFKYINFAGTPQDLEHFKKLENEEKERA